MNSEDNDLFNLETTNNKFAGGFPSPAEDYMQARLDLNKRLIKHPAATFFMRANGGAMCDAGILNNDILIVDKSLTPQNNSIVIAILNGNFIVRRFKIFNNDFFLYPANKDFTAIKIDDNCQIWGVVTHAIHNLCAG